uniref:Death-associated protein 1 n=1 Tax=Esox lucius TaxID=8010 RepID=A0AAY5KZL5_ESOLU
MSSPPKEKIETKGGHLPAVKAGGMRIVQKHQGATPPEPPSNKDKDDEEYVEEPRDLQASRSTINVEVHESAVRDCAVLAYMGGHEGRSLCSQNRISRHD